MYVIEGVRERGNRYIERARSLSGCIQERSKDITTIGDREREIKCMCECKCEYDR